MKFNSWRFYMGILLATSAYGQELPYKYSGVYYDSTSEQYFVNNRPMFNIRALGGSKFLDRIEYSIDDVEFAPYTNGIKFNQEGLHTLRFKAVDPVKNWSPVQSFRIFADLTMPTSQLSWFGDSFEKGGTNFISPKAKLVITANDNLSGVSRIVWKGDGEAKEYTGPKLFEKEGQYQLQYMAIDNVGNIEPWRAYNFTVDSTHPASTIELKGVKHITNNKIFTRFGSHLEIASADQGSGVKGLEVKINASEAQKYEHPIPLDKKVTNVQFRGIDNVGNIEKWHEYTVHVDTDAPEIKVSSIGNHKLLSGKIYATSGFKLGINALDKDSGLKSILVNNEEKAPAPKEAITFDKEGSFEVSIAALDNVGNKSATQSFSVIIDDTPPNSKINTDLALVEWEGVLFSSIPNKLSILTDDNGVGVEQMEVSYDGKTYSKLTGAIDFSTWKEQQRTIYYRSRDHLGNVEPEKKITIAIRDKGPAIGLFVETEELGDIPLSEVKGKTGRSLASEPKKKK